MKRDPFRNAVDSPENKAMMSASLKAARARISAGEGFIYVAEVIGTDAVKIGFSLNPERRLGPKARLLGYFPASIKAERALHVRLASHRHPDFGLEVYPRSIFVHGAAA